MAMNASTDIPKLEPHSLEAEQSVLGAVLLDNAALATARELVSVEDFYRTAHRMIYRAMLDLADHSQAIDNLTLSDALTANGLLADVGGASYLAELLTEVSSAANVSHHARIVAEKAKLRIIRKTLYAALDAADAGSSLEHLATFIDRLKVATMDKAEGKPHLKQALLEYGELVRAELPKRAMRLPWLSDGSINMIFGPRGVGKTMFGARLAASLCTGRQFLKWEVSEPVGVLFVDGEMPLHDLRDRITRLLPCPPNAPLHFLTAEHVYHTLRTDLVLTAESMREQIVGILDTNPALKVLILDNISCLFAGLDEDKKRDWEPINAWLIRLRHRGISSVLMHHAGKGGQQRGTSGREDALDITIHLDRPADYDSRQGCRFELRFTKSRRVYGDMVAPLEVALDQQCRFTWKPLEESKEQAARKLYGEGVTSPSDLAEELGITKGYASKLLHKLKRETSAHE